METPTKQLIDQLKRLSSDALVIHFLGNAAARIIAEAANQLIELKNQRNELLEALEEIEWSNNEQWRTDRARIAIAKAKGE